LCAETILVVVVDVALANRETGGREKWMDGWMKKEKKIEHKKAIAI
jgi:hypothetical protein